MRCKTQTTHQKTPNAHTPLPGYTQSGPLFRSKTRALEKLLAKSLAPLRLRPTLLYPTAPNRLSVRDIPGYQPQQGSSGVAAAEEEQGRDGEDTTDAWAWFRRDEATGSYRLLREGMVALADYIRAEAPGGVDGVVGFSQGGAVAAMLAAALEYLPPTAPASASSSSSSLAPQSSSQTQRQPPPPPSSTTTAATTDSSDTHDWLSQIRAANAHRPLRFAVIYSGFYPPETAGLGWLIGGAGADNSIGTSTSTSTTSRSRKDSIAAAHGPKVRTPTLHFIGSLDTVVEEGRSRGLVARCEDPLVVVHPGGHYVPVSKEWVNPLVGFVRRWCEDDADE